MTGEGSGTKCAGCGLVRFRSAERCPRCGQEAPAPSHVPAPIGAIGHGAQHPFRIHLLPSRDVVGPFGSGALPLYLVRHGDESFLVPSGVHQALDGLTIFVPAFIAILLHVTRLWSSLVRGDFMSYVAVLMVGLWCLLLSRSVLRVVQWLQRRTREHLLEAPLDSVRSRALAAWAREDVARADVSSRLGATVLHLTLRSGSEYALAATRPDTRLALETIGRSEGGDRARTLASEALPSKG